MYAIHLNKIYLEKCLKINTYLKTAKTVKICENTNGGSKIILKGYIVSRHLKSMSSLSNQTLIQSEDILCQSTTKSIKDYVKLIIETRKKIS